MIQTSSNKGLDKASGPISAILGFINRRHGTTRQNSTEAKSPSSQESSNNTVLSQAKSNSDCTHEDSPQKSLEIADNLSKTRPSSKAPTTPVKATGYSTDHESYSVTNRQLARKARKRQKYKMSKKERQRKERAAEMRHTTVRSLESSADNAAGSEEKARLEQMNMEIEEKSISSKVDKFIPHKANKSPQSTVSGVKRAHQDLETGTPRNDGARIQSKKRQVEKMSPSVEEGFVQETARGPESSGAKEKVVSNASKSFSQDAENVKGKKRYKKYEATSKRVIINPSSESESDWESTLASEKPMQTIRSDDELEPAQPRESSSQTKIDPLLVEELFNSGSSDAAERAKASLFINSSLSDQYKQLFVPSDPDSTPSFENKSPLVREPSQLQTTKSNPSVVSGSPESSMEKNASPISSDNQRAKEQHIKHPKQTKLNKKRKSKERKLHRLKLKDGITAGQAKSNTSNSSSRSEEGQKKSEYESHNLTRQIPEVQDAVDWNLDSPESPPSLDYHDEAGNHDSSNLFVMEDSDTEKIQTEADHDAPSELKRAAQVELSSASKLLDSHSSLTPPPEIIVVDSESEPEDIRRKTRLRSYQPSVKTCATVVSSNRVTSEPNSDHSYHEASSVIIPNSSQSVESEPERMQVPSRQIEINSSQDTPSRSLVSSPVTKHKAIPHAKKKESPMTSSPKSVFDQMKERFNKSGVEFRGFGIDAEIWSDFI